MEDKSPKGKSSFPTSHSFLAEDIPHHPSTSRTTYKPVETKDEGYQPLPTVFPKYGIFHGNYLIPCL
jgi:hypothetical protein